jgi:demethylmenaquinone methyltransferase/2-methoxy-6-polyprenyl-1,4-benzoquinol methylase
MLSPVPDDPVLAEQLTYYRRRAAEYDRTAFGDLEAAGRRIAGIVAALRPTGDVLELACGTGMWTGALAGWADTMTALDAAPEMLAAARARVPDRRVGYMLADVFGWQPARRYDTVFFAFWLSHVPPDRFDQFWALLRDWLAPGGRVLFVDEHPGAADKELYPDPGGYLVERRLADGSVHRVVKVLAGADEIGHRLSVAGWRSAIRADGPDWLVGEARPLP